MEKQSVGEEMMNKLEMILGKKKVDQGTGILHVAINDKSQYELWQWQGLVKVGKSK